VRARLAGSLPAARLDALPRSWTRLGRVLVLPLPPELDAWRAEVAEAYASELRCEAVLREAGPISGALREPTRELLWGDGTETVHVEGGVRYAMDAARVMWSAGNVRERQRIPRLVREGEVVVDLFAGIGYFALPIAVKAQPERVVACERNPVAFRYLERNVALNRAEGEVEPKLGDCRVVAPRGAADRVLMGYTVGTERFLPAALAALRPEGGALHYHEVCPAHVWDQQPWGRVRAAAEAAGREATLAGQRVVKSYAPGRVHVVVDAEVRP
jgi:tRNA wybutosine-synthesizing protein 2